jgi:uncharacterized membrane protein YphA (DoxX/SURF4 family)
MANEPKPGLLATIQDTTDWGFLLLLRVVAGLPLLFFGILHLVSPDILRDIMAAAGLPAVFLHSIVVPLAEILGGVLLLGGFLTRLGAVLAFGVVVTAALVTLQVADRSAALGVPTLAVPVTLAVASFFLALLGGGSASIDQRMLRQRAVSPASAQTTIGPRPFFRWSGSDAIVIVLGLLVLFILMYLIWGRAKQRELSYHAAPVAAAASEKEYTRCL